MDFEVMEHFCRSASFCLIIHIAQPMNFKFRSDIEGSVSELL